MDTQRIRELLDQRDAIDKELRELVHGEVKERKPVRCSSCGEEGHNARACPKKT